MVVLHWKQRMFCDKHGYVYETLSDSEIIPHLCCKVNNYIRVYKKTESLTSLYAIEAMLTIHVKSIPYNTNLKRRPKNAQV